MDIMKEILRADVRLGGRVRETPLEPSPHLGDVALGLGSIGIEGIIFVPETVSPTKADAIRRLGGPVRLHGIDAVATEIHARDFAAANGMVYVSPYNDLQVVGGANVAIEPGYARAHVDVQSRAFKAFSRRPRHSEDRSPTARRRGFRLLYQGGRDVGRFGKTPVFRS